MDSDFDIRSKIIIPDGLSIDNFIYYSDIELAAEYSKNENNFNILKLLLDKNMKELDNKMINDVLKLTCQNLGSTADFNAIKLLINYGADINFIDGGGWTLLMHYCISKTLKIKIINLLIENGSNINVSNNRYSQPLTLLIKFCKEYSDLEIIKLLISKGSNINFKDSDGDTLLMMCLKSNYNCPIKNDIIKLLLDNKADAYIKNKKNKNIFHIIENNFGKNSDIYSLIFNYKNLEGLYLCEYDIDFIY